MSADLTALTPRLHALNWSECEAVLFRTIGGVESTLRHRPRAGLACFAQILERQVAGVERGRAARTAQISPTPAGSATARPAGPLSANAQPTTQ